MLGSTRQPLRASACSARILRFAYHYGTFLGVVWFGINRSGIDGSLIARNRYWFKWCCVVSRILIACYFVYDNTLYICSIDNIHLKILWTLHLIGCVICVILILVLQLLYEEQLLLLVNRFLRLFGRARALPGCQQMGFGGKRELALLVFMVLSMVYAVSCAIPEFLNSESASDAVGTLVDLYNGISASMISHVCFLGYLSVGALYEQVNNYVRHELRRQLRALEKPHGVQASRREIRAAGYRLDECLDLYDEIRRVGNAFQQFFDLPLAMILFFGFTGMAMVAYYILLHNFRNISLWLMASKMFKNLVLVTVAIHGAGTSSRVIRRLSLENCYVSERNEWHMKLEMFLSRLNFFEFHVCPMGLFEISNKLILVFLSAMVTYLTYIIQYGIQSHEI